MYKCTLNELCQKRGLEPPKYSYTKFGQDHNALHKAQVIVNDSMFKSPHAFSNHRSAENDVAEVTSSHFTTFSQVASDVMEETKKMKDSHLILSSDFNSGALNKNVESCVPIWPNSIKSSIIEPNPIKSMGTFSLCDKIKVYAGIHDNMSTQGDVALPIDDGRWTVVNLESA